MVGTRCGSNTLDFISFQYDNGENEDERDELVDPIKLFLKTLGMKRSKRDKRERRNKKYYGELHLN